MGDHVDNVDRFIGKTGGEIFHEMMLRQKVEHICKATNTIVGCVIPSD
jgi:hypothetical protein